jgi:hypothetical protein
LQIRPTKQPQMQRPFGHIPPDPQSAATVHVVPKTHALQSQPFPVQAPVPQSPLLLQAAPDRQVTEQAQTWLIVHLPPLHASSAMHMVPSEHVGFCGSLQRVPTIRSANAKPTAAYPRLLMAPLGGTVRLVSSAMVARWRSAPTD